MALFYTWTTNPGGTDFWVLPINNSDGFYGAWSTALAMLTAEDNWGQAGAITVEQAAIAASEMFADMFVMPDPTGQILLYGGAVAGLVPAALLCDGSSYPTTTYPQLFGVIGYTFGGSGANFKVPDLRSVVPTGAGGTILGSSVSVGSSGGAESHSQTVSELATHSHADTGHSHAESVAAPNVTTIGAGAPQPTAVPAIGVTGIGNANIQNSGSGVAMPTFPPYLGLNFVIVTGIPR